MGHQKRQKHLTTPPPDFDSSMYEHEFFADDEMETSTSEEPSLDGKIHLPLIQFHIIKPITAFKRF